MPTFALNFSRPGAQVVAQYYNFLRLGPTATARSRRPAGTRRSGSPLRSSDLGPFTLVSRAEGIPVFAFRLTDTLPYSVYDISEALRSFGWLVPAYTLAPALDDVAVLRVVVRNGFSRDLAKMLLDNLADGAEETGDLGRAEPGTDGGRRRASTTAQLVARQPSFTVPAIPRSANTPSLPSGTPDPKRGVQWTRTSHPRWRSARAPGAARPALPSGREATWSSSCQSACRVPHGTASPSNWSSSCSQRTGRRHASDAGLAARAAALGGPVPRWASGPPRSDGPHASNGVGDRALLHSREIRIASRLQTVPEWVLDGVIVHELAHLLEAGHTARFHELANRYPRQVEAHTYLDGFGHGLTTAGFPLSAEDG